MKCPACGIEYRKGSYYIHVRTEQHKAAAKPPKGGTTK